MPGKNSLLRLNSALQITNRTCEIIFPVLAGILIAILGVRMMLAIDGLTFIVSAASVALARLPRKTAGERVRSSIWSDLTAGIAYVMRQVLSPVGYALASVVSDAVGLAGVIGIAGAIMAVTAVGLLVFLKSVPVPDEQHETG